MDARDNEREPADLVAAEDGCPTCGQREVDELVWLDDEHVQCQRCHTTYRPGGDDPATE